MRHRRSTILAVALAAVIGLGATTAAAAPERRPSGAGATGNVVKIGVLAPLDAGLVEFGKGIRNSVQVAVDQANARKAIPGFTIELSAVNDGSDPATGAAGAATLVADPDVVGLVGTYNSGVAQAALPVLAPASLALVSPSNTLTELTLGPDATAPARPDANYFRMVASDALQAPFLADSVKKLGAKKVAVVSETKAVSKGLADAFATAFTDGGGTVTVQKVVPDGNTDFTNFLDSALPGKPDMIFFGGEYHVAAELRGQASQAGFTKPLVGGDGIKDPAYITDAGPVSKGTLASSVGTPLASLKTAKKFLAAYTKAKFDDPPTDYGPYAYDAANIIIAAAKKALAGQDAIGADTRPAVVANVQPTKTKGASGPVSFDKYGDTTNQVFTLYKVSGPKAKLAFVPFTP
jgi:branched-chain amino acid transport system substrate-binding protein